MTLQLAVNWEEVHYSGEPVAVAVVTLRLALTLLVVGQMAGKAVHGAAILLAAVV